MLDAEIKNLIEDQGKAFDAFKKTYEEELKEVKKGVSDPVLKDRMAKIEKSLDDAVEAKTALEAKFDAEKKEREDLELRFSRLGNPASRDEKKAVYIDDLNRLVKAVARDRGKAAELMDEKAYDAFTAAHSKFLREGKEALNADEVKTLSVGSDPDGGYFVTPDMTGRTVKRVYETSPMRQIASQITISTDRIEGIEDLGEAGVGYAGENAQGSDTTTPQIGKWAINVYWFDTEPKTTQQILDDANVNVEAWLADKVANKFGRFENAEFVNGATKIRGLTSYTTASDTGSGVTWGSVGYAFTGVSGGFAASNPVNNLLDTIGLLKNDYQANARWIMKRKTITAVRKLADSTGQLLWQPSLVAGAPEMLFGYPITRMEDLADIGANSLSIGFGDFSQAYQIVDRQGISVLRDVYTQKPFVKFYTRKRAGGGVVNFEAFKWLKFGTS